MRDGPERRRVMRGWPRPVLERRRLARKLYTGRSSARGDQRRAVPRQTGRHWRPEEIVERADQVAGELEVR